jgi:glucokinase
MVKTTGVAVGVDLGGTNLRAAVVDCATGRVLVSQRQPTHAHEGHAAVIERMASLIRAVLGEYGWPGQSVQSVGIGVPGTPDLERGLVMILPNLPGQWREVPLQAEIEQRLSLPTSLINDVRAITLGEWAFGAGRGVDTVACYAIGTGIGGGLIINGRLHLGLDGTAGELGHTVVEPDGLPCSCGGRGCLELYTSGPAIAAMGAKAVIHGHTTLIDALVSHDLNKITVEVVAQAALQGDIIALGIFERVGTYLGISIGNILHTISPQRVILAGGVAQAGNLLVEPIWRTIRQRVHLMPVDKVEIVFAQLGGNAGLVGSALWAANRLSGEKIE